MAAGMSLARKASIACCLALCCLASCSRPSDPAAAKRSEPAPREFSKDDKIAARSLSLANTGAEVAGGTPYAQALLCRHAIDVVYNRLRGAGSLNDAQLGAFGAARTFFDRQVGALAAKQGRNSGEVRADLARTALDHPEFAENAQQLVACLRKQQNGG